MKIDTKVEINKKHFEYNIIAHIIVLTLTVSVSARVKHPRNVLNPHFTDPHGSMLPSSNFSYICVNTLSVKV